MKLSHQVMCFFVFCGVSPQIYASIWKTPFIDPLRSLFFVCNNGPDYMSTVFLFRKWRTFSFKTKPPELTSTVNWKQWWFTHSLPSDTTNNTFHHRQIIVKCFFVAIHLKHSSNWIISFKQIASCPRIVGFNWRRYISGKNEGLLLGELSGSHVYLCILEWPAESLPISIRM